MEKSDMNPRFTLAAGALALLAVFPALAADQDGNAIVVTATRTSTRTSELLSDVSIVDREQVERFGASTLPELIATLPGVQTTSNGGQGSTSSFSLRGTNTNQTLVLIDGQRMSSATTGAAAFEHIPLEQVERIEVLRGPASSLYGSDAMGGVIQIFTRQGFGAPAPSFSLGAGSYRTRQGSAAYGGQLGDTSFNIQAGWERSNSFSTIKEAKGGPYDMFNADSDPYGNDNLSARFSTKIDSDLSFGGELLRINGAKHFDATNCDNFGVCTANFDNRQQQQLASYSAHIAYNVAPLWKSVLRVGRSQDNTLNFHFDPTAAIQETEQHYDTTQDQVVWQNDFTLSPGNKAMAALEWRKVHVNSTEPFTETDQTTRSVVLSYQGNFGAHSLQISERVDDIQRTGSHNNGSLAYGYHFTDALSARLGVGTAYHAPTFNDLYWPLDKPSYFKGNPNLKPERSKNIEAGVSYERAGTVAGLTVYQNKVKDLIDYVPGAIAPDYIGTNENVHSATLQGASLSFARRSGNWEFRSAIDFLSAKDDATGNTLQRRANQTGVVEVRHILGAFDIGAQLQGVSGRFNNPANTQRLSGYALLNLDTNYRFERDWSVFAKINNLLDKDYTLVRSTLSPYNDYSTPGRNFFVGIRYQPK